MAIYIYMVIFDYILKVIYIKYNDYLRYNPKPPVMAISLYHLFKYTIFYSIWGGINQLYLKW